MNFYFFYSSSILLILRQIGGFCVPCGFNPTAFRNQTVAPSGFPSISISTPRLFQARGSASTLRRYPHADFQIACQHYGGGRVDVLVITSSGKWNAATS